MSEPSNASCLWTAWCDYHATGEGRSIMACIAYADSEEKMRAHFTEKFGDWFAKGCEIQKGVARSAATRLLWSEDALVAMEDCEKRRGSIDANSWLHFNFA